MNAQRRLRLSYEMMLGFFGMSLSAGDVPSRAANWEERFDSLRRFCFVFSLLLVVVDVLLPTWRRSILVRKLVSAGELSLSYARLLAG